MARLLAHLPLGVALLLILMRRPLAMVSFVVVLVALRCVPMKSPSRPNTNAPRCRLYPSVIPPRIPLLSCDEAAGITPFAKARSKVPARAPFVGDSVVASSGSARI